MIDQREWIMVTWRTFCLRSVHQNALKIFWITVVPLCICTCWILVHRKFVHWRSVIDHEPSWTLEHRQATIRNLLQGSMNRGGRYKRYKHHKHNRNRCADKSKLPASTPASTSLQVNLYNAANMSYYRCDILSHFLLWLAKNHKRLRQTYLLLIQIQCTADFLCLSFFTSMWVLHPVNAAQHTHCRAQRIFKAELLLYSACTHLQNTNVWAQCKHKTLCMGMCTKRMQCIFRSLRCFYECDWRVQNYVH